MKRRCRVLFVTLAILLAGCGGGGGSSTSTTSSKGIVHFVPNSHTFWSDPANWTTTFGPAYANIALASTNFVPCRGGPYALCYYSGPELRRRGSFLHPTDQDGHYANCQCFDIPYGVYFVDINAILNHSVYEKTIAQCGTDGSMCATINSAPVCQRQSRKSDSRLERLLHLQLRLCPHERNRPDQLPAPRRTPDA